MFPARRQARPHFPLAGGPARRRVPDPPTCSRAPLHLHEFPCDRKICQAFRASDDDGAKLTRWVTRWILQPLATDRMSVTATAKALAVGRELVN